MSKLFVTVQEAKEMSKEEQEELLDAIEKDAHDNEVTYWGCSQAVLASLQQHLKIGSVESFKAMSPFAGGVARTHEMCGALLAGVMAIGLVYGRSKFEPGKVAMEQFDMMEAEVRGNKLCQRFKEKFGSFECPDVYAFVRLRRILFRS